MLKHVEDQNIEISKLQLQLRDANSRMVDMNYKTSLDVARLLEDERASAETDRQKFLSQISALYDSSFQRRWNRLQGNYGIICNDISISGDLIENCAKHDRLEECITRQKMFSEELLDLKNQQRARMGEGWKVICLSLFNM